MQVLETGFPTIPHDEAPLQYIATSELFYYPLALSALAFEDARYVIRFPAACWATATALLIFWTGRRMMNVQVGLIAALIYSIAPLCIAMGSFGRYPAQVGFFALLSLFFLWRLIQRPWDSRALWYTTFSFLAMYLSWQGSAFLAIGMVAALFHAKRADLRMILTRPATWAAVVTVVSVVALHASHRTLQASHQLFAGSGITNMGLTSMWKFADYDPTYYLLRSGWDSDGLLPLLGLAAAAILALRHGFRHPVRVLMIVFVVTSFVMATFMPIRAFRYAYHLVPFTILLCSASLVASTRALTLLTKRHRAPAPWMAYAQGMGVLITGSFVALSSGAAETRDLGLFQARNFHVALRDHPNVEKVAEFLNEHVQDGDIVFASKPHVIAHYLPDRKADFWLQTRLHNRVMIGDTRPLALDRRSDTILIPSRDALEDVFARNQRVWYIFEPQAHESCNVGDVSRFVREHMDVVREDFSSILLFRGTQHRPTSLRQEDEEELDRARENFLR